jgi:hypothetical protein
MAYSQQGINPLEDMEREKIGELTIQELVKHITQEDTQ